VEWTIRYGIRSDHPNARGLEADMLAFDPKYRTEADTKEFGDKRFLTPEEIDDVVQYVLEISGQPADRVKAARGDILFHDGAKGNCFDCHGEDATGSPPIGPHAGIRRRPQARGDQGRVGVRLLFRGQVIFANGVRIP
jgi:mono/diheme cytochrome c family protein